jgi:hypothetical protein
VDSAGTIREELLHFWNTESWFLWLKLEILDRCAHLEMLPDAKRGEWIFPFFCYLISLHCLLLELTLKKPAVNGA